MAKNKSYNKLIAGTMTAAMVAGVVAPVAASAEQTKSFPDVPANHWSADSINYLVGKGAINGKPDGTFAPTEEMDRASIAKVIAITLGLEIKEDAKPSFEDSKNHWAAKYIAAVEKAGVIVGDGSGSFDPNGKVNRASIASMLVKAYELDKKVTGTPETKFEDLKGHWGKDYANILVELGISNGTDTGWEPEKATTRAEVAQFIAKTDAKYGEKVEKEIKVESVNATNGKLTVKLTKELEATPISSEFKIVQNINGTTKAISASSVSYDEATKTVELVVPQLSATEVDQTVSYTVGYKETAAVASNSFAIAKVGELKATNATQISSTQVKVTFNQKVTKATAEKLTNYTIGKAQADGKVDTTGYKAFSDNTTKAVLQEDGQTVIITLGAAEDATGTASIIGTAGQFDNNTAYLVNVSTDVLPQAGKAAEKAAELPFTLNDNTAPTVEKFTVNEAGNLVVSFNEKLNVDQDVDVLINGQKLAGKPAYSAATGKSTVTFTKKQLTDAKPAGFGLELGKTYTVAVSAAQDAYGKAMNIYSSKFTYTTAAEAPKVTKVESKGEKTITVTFSEPVYKQADGDKLDGTSFNITKGAKHFAAPAVTTTDDTTFTLVFDTADQKDDFIFDRYHNETSVNLDVHVADVKDSVGNITPASKHAVTVTKDTVKPEVVKKENKVDAVVDLTFNKTLNATKVTATHVASKAYVLTSAGVKLPLADGDVDLTNIASKKLSFDLAAVGAETLQPGSYTLVVESGAIVDTALNGGNVNNEIRVPFVVATDGLEKKPVVDSVVADGKAGDIVVTFEEQISYESAAKAANYVIDGTAIPAASKFALAADGKTLTITLPEATYTETADKVMKINGVRNLAGTVMDEHEAVLTVKENEKISLKSAKVVNGDIFLTFNENVNNDVADTNFDTDFGIKVNGVVVNGYTLADHEDDTSKIAKNQIKVTAPAGISFATGTITVEAVKDATVVKDAAGNELLIDGKLVTATR